MESCNQVDCFTTGKCRTHRLVHQRSTVRQTAQVDGDRDAMFIQLKKHCIVVEHLYHLLPSDSKRLDFVKVDLILSSNRILWITLRDQRRRHDVKFWKKLTLLANRHHGFIATHPPTESYVVFDITFGGEGRSPSDGEGDSPLRSPTRFACARSRLSQGPKGE